MPIINSIAASAIVGKKLSPIRAYDTKNSKIATGSNWRRMANENSRLRKPVEFVALAIGSNDLKSTIYDGGRYFVII